MNEYEKLYAQYIANGYSHSLADMLASQRAAPAPPPSDLANSVWAQHAEWAARSRARRKSEE